MATNCMRKLFNTGEYVFRQGDVPNQLCVILDGKIEIIREIVYSRCNRWPVGKLCMIHVCGDNYDYDDDHDVELMMIAMMIIMVVLQFYDVFIDDDYYLYDNTDVR